MQAYIEDSVLVKKYDNLRGLAEKISKLSSTTHYYIFEVLKKNNVHYSMNNNGVFINFENMPEHVVKNIEDIINIHGNRTPNLSVVATLDTTQEDLKKQAKGKEPYVESPEPLVATVPLENQASCSKTVPKLPIYTIYDECQRAIKESAPDDDPAKADVRQIWNNFEKEKHNSKKSSVNTFLNAKKKYSRQVITETKIYPPFLEKDL